MILATILMIIRNLLMIILVALHCCEHVKSHVAEQVNRSPHLNVLDHGIVCSDSTATAVAALKKTNGLSDADRGNADGRAVAALFKAAHLKWATLTRAAEATLTQAETTLKETTRRR